MSDFAPGDVVVCVDASAHRLLPDSAPKLRQGGTYRVLSFYRKYERAGLSLCEHGGSWGWKADRFRKIDPASESFTEQVRACRPIRKEVSA